MITVEAERAKYNRIWAIDGYHRSSPGERLVPDFLERLPWRAGESVIDAGCGTGRAAKRLSRAGLSAFMLDFVNAVDADNKLPFIEACLWDISAQMEFDWIFCADVLEHIPPEHVESALRGLSSMTRKGGVLQIAMFEDSFGSLIDETLHLTVRPSPWWLERIEPLWQINSMTISNDPRLTVFLGPRRGPANGKSN